jgi:hypothetical protein
MGIQNELNSYQVDYSEIKKRFGHDASKKIGAILDILEIGGPSIAHSKLILHTCEDLLDKCSLTFGTKTDV